MIQHYNNLFDIKIEFLAAQHQFLYGIRHVDAKKKRNAKNKKNISQLSSDGIQFEIFFYFTLQQNEKVANISSIH